jgi:uncharacterized protein (DUF2235 family)
MTQSSETGSGAGKNVVVLCDGTANQVTVFSQTNVLRLARLLQKEAGGGRRQVVYYDPGLGTEGAPGALTPVGRGITKFLGLAFGYGLTKNLSDAYAFLVQHYEPGDRIYIFGFSRGAYTARALTGLLQRVGLLERGCDNLIPYAIRYFQARDGHQLNFFKQRFSRTYHLLWREVVPSFAEIPRLQEKANRPSRGVIPVHFLGVWDTVKSIGTLRRRITLPDTDWLPNMINGRHAVALDEERSQYRPELWECDTDSGHAERLKEKRFQVCLHADVETMWFAGVHSDVGGGYGISAKLERKLIEKREKPSKPTPEELEKKQAEIGLAHISLQWMMEAAAKHGLLFDHAVLAEEPLTPDVRATLHNPLLPFWWVLAWWHRTLPADAQIHPSVEERKQKVQGYKPAAR